MARGPFQGTFQHGVRPTIVTSPDAVVFLNGESNIIGCPKCRRRFDWNKYITSIQVDLSVQSVPGSASFTLSIPRHSVDDFFLDGNPLISPMMEVEIFAKGYFLVEGLPQYYPIFWGLTTEVSDGFSGGEHTVNISCADILKWWEVCKMNVNPAFTQSMGQQGRSLFGNVFSGTNPYDIIWSLAQHSFGDVIVGSGSLLSMYKETSQKATFATSLKDTMIYWENRFRNIRSNLLLYGTRGNAVRGDYINKTVDFSNENNVYNPDNPKRQLVSQLVRKADGGEDGAQMVFDPTDPNVTAFRTQFGNAGQVNFWQSEYQTKLEIANAAKDCIGYEFYMDVTGDVVFKPPFFNLDIMSNKPVSWIQDIDIIDWDLSESEAEVITQLQIQGSFGGNIDYGFGEEMTPATSVTDYHLLREYGWRVETFNSEFMASPLHMFYMGLDMLDRMNAQRFRGTVNIPCRPELRLGFPIYIAPKDQIWYIQGISHSIQMGGRAQTTLTLSAKRSKFVAPKGIGTIRLSSQSGKNARPTARQLSRSGTFEADIGEAAQLPPTNYPERPGDPDPYAPLILRHPKTGRIVGYPNVVMAYTRPFEVPPAEINKVLGRRPEERGRGAQSQGQTIEEQNELVQKQLQDSSKVLQITKQDRIRAKYFSNRYTYGLNTAGVYTYLHDTSSVVREMLLIPKNRVRFAQDDSSGRFQGTTGMIRPVSDERGFEVIGHYKYGRGVSLRDGSLVLNTTEQDPNATNSRAEVRPQIAVSGGLFESLEAQSQGLVDLHLGTTDVNPAYAVTRLAPDGTDLQTAGFINPETKEPEFSDTSTNFVDVSPLDSPAQKGAPVNVEASQLSRSLTLAEMGVQDEVSASDTNCSCLLGRSDLAFINVGYNVKILRSTDVDESAAIQAEQEAIEASQEEARQVISQAEDSARARAEEEYILFSTGVTTSTPEAQEWIEAKVAAARQDALESLAEERGVSVDQVTQSLTEGEKNASGAQPVAEGPALSRKEAISRVEQFLVELYSALDTPHQEYESILRRGSTQRRPTNDYTGTGYDTNQGTDRNLAPPFSAGTRGLGGDLDALALQGSTAVDDLAKTWGEFGQNLQSNTRLAQLQAEKAQLEQRINDLSQLIKELEEAGEGNVTLTLPGSTLEDLKESLDEARQDLANVNHELSTLSNQ